MKNIGTFKCPFCGKGSMVTTTMDYEIVDSLKRKTIIPNIKVDTCNACGEKFFGYEAAVRLEEIKKKESRVTLSLNPELQKRIKSAAEKHKRTFDEEVEYLLEGTLA